MLPLAIIGQSVVTKIFFTKLDFLDAIKGYSNKALPKTFLKFLFGNPVLHARPIINAQIIFFLPKFDYTKKKNFYYFGIIRFVFFLLNQTQIALNIY